MSICSMPAITPGRQALLTSLASMEVMRSRAPTRQDPAPLRLLLARARADLTRADIAFAAAVMGSGLRRERRAAVASLTWRGLAMGICAQDNRNPSVVRPFPAPISRCGPTASATSEPDKIGRA